MALQEIPSGDSFCLASGMLEAGAGEVAPPLEVRAFAHVKHRRRISESLLMVAAQAFATATDLLVEDFL